MGTELRAGVKYLVKWMELRECSGMGRKHVPYEQLEVYTDGTD